MCAPMLALQRCSRRLWGYYGCIILASSWLVAQWLVGDEKMVVMVEGGDNKKAWAAATNSH